MLNDRKCCGSHHSFRAAKTVAFILEDALTFAHKSVIDKGYLSLNIFSAFTCSRLALSRILLPEFLAVESANDMWRSSLS